MNKQVLRELNKFRLKAKKAFEQEEIGAIAEFTPVLEALRKMDIKALSKFTECFFEEDTDKELIYEIVFRRMWIKYETILSLAKELKYVEITQYTYAESQFSEDQYDQRVDRLLWYNNDLRGELHTMIEEKIYYTLSWFKCHLGATNEELKLFIKDYNLTYQKESELLNLLGRIDLC